MNNSVRSLLRPFSVTRQVLVVAVAAFALLLVGIAPASAVQTISVRTPTLTDHECDDTEWHFVITGIDTNMGPAPPTIHVTWANGAVEDVPLDMLTPGGVAHYATNSNLDSTVTNATAEIYDGWGGPGEQFNLSHGPCNVPPPNGNGTTTTTTPGQQVTPPGAPGAQGVPGAPAPVVRGAAPFTG